MVSAPKSTAGKSVSPTCHPFAMTTMCPLQKGCMEVTKGLAAWKGCRMLDVGCRMRDAGCGMLDAGHWELGEHP